MSSVSFDLNIPSNVEDSITIISQDQLSDGGNDGKLSNMEDVFNASKELAISETQMM